MSAWISVEDGAPEEHEIVLVWDGSLIGVATWLAADSAWLSDTEWTLQGGITHWVSLPDSPVKS